MITAIFKIIAGIALRLLLFVRREDSESKRNLRASQKMRKIEEEQRDLDAKTRRRRARRWVRK